MKEIAVITENGAYPPETPAPHGDYPMERISVRVLLFDREGKIALNHYPLKSDWDEEWLIPGGGVEEGESLMDALRREVMEETGCEINQIEELGFTKRYFPVEKRCDKDYCFAAIVDGEKNVPKFIQRDIDYKLESIWMYPEEALSKLNLADVLNPESRKNRARTLVMRHNTAFLLNLAKNRTIRQ